MRSTALHPIAAAGLLAVTLHATASADTSSDKARLGMALSCQGSAQPHELISWISNLGGGAIINSIRVESGTEYTLPDPVYVLGFPVTRANIRAFHGASHDYTVYEAIFPDKSFREIASIAGLTPDEAGNYQQRIGKNHLYLREQGDATYVTCAIGVHRSGLGRALHAPAKENDTAMDPRSGPRAKDRPPPTW
ncbi:hypothetical protein [Castellaniella sp.]|uniref:hypothetical protein n=1 Tax=Castellaniella sp. TaxID=1955812 RepID=UPI002AFEFC6C|nr:hypothetical protein [Castellaniella sp.]